MREMKSKHTSSYIAPIIINVPEVYDINVKRIFSITTDNEANMLKTVSILAKMDSEVSDENDFYDNFNEFDEYY